MDLRRFGGNETADGLLLFYYCFFTADTRLINTYINIMKKVKKRASQKAKEVPINENLLYAERNIWSPMYKGL